MLLNQRVIPAKGGISSNTRLHSNLFIFPLPSVAAFPVINLK